MLVYTRPSELVNTTCPGTSSGRSLASTGFPEARSGLYVDVARSLCIGDLVGTDVLKRYEGVVYVGVGSSEFGKFVATVIDKDENMADSEDCDIGVVVVCVEYRPIMGGSMFAMP